MTRACNTLVMLAALLMLAPLAARAEEPQRPQLRWDPFREPVRVDESAVPGARAQAGDWSPVLRAVLASADGGFANLGGRILRPGESAHGYMLVEVHDFSAVFERSGQRVTLEVTREGRR